MGAADEQHDDEEREPMEEVATVAQTVDLRREQKRKRAKAERASKKEPSKEPNKEPKKEPKKEPSYERIGRFTVLHKIAEGGMGIVYAALDEQLNRKVAIKLLHTSSDRGDQAHERMMREARAMARLSHPNVVQVHEVGEIDGKVFVAMEYVQGLTLRKWLNAEPRSWRDILEIFRQAGQGLVAAHNAGIIHRDFKPDNVIVGKDRRVKVLDFGLARWHGQDGDEAVSSNPLSGSGSSGSVGSSKSSEPSGPPGRSEASGSTSLPNDLGEAPLHEALSAPSEPSEPFLVAHSGDIRSLTKTGFVMGTPAYMSPEQHKGYPADARSDQFSFCVALYEALYGRRPFPGRSYRQVALSILNDPPLDPPARSRVPRWLRRVVVRGLSRDPSQRWPSMEGLLSAFEDFQARVDVRNTNMLRLETGLGLFLIPAFWVLDWFFLPEHLLLALVIRMGSALGAIFLHLLCRTRPRLVERHVDALTFAFNLLVGWSLAAIIWMEGGMESPYYAGLNLLILAMGIMFLWTLKLALLINAIIYLVYLSPLLLGFLDLRDGAVVLMNQFFMISTIIITVAAQHQRFKQERREFLAEQERRQLREEVNALARVGQRPELHDRAQFLLLGEDEVQRSRRYNRPMACLVLGIDNFGDVSERYGDFVGNEVLEHLAQRIVKDIRQFDLVGKYHGDEFVFLLPETRLQQAEDVAERLVEKFGRRPVSTRAGVVELSLSAGVAIMSEQTPDLLSLLGRAISGLEQAKRQGGARTMTWSGEHMISTQEAGLVSGKHRPRRSRAGRRRSDRVDSPASGRRAARRDA